MIQLEEVIDTLTYVKFAALECLIVGRVGLC